MDFYRACLMILCCGHGDGFLAPLPDGGFRTPPGPGAWAPNLEQDPQASKTILHSAWRPRNPLPSYKGFPCARFPAVLEMLLTFRRHFAAKATFSGENSWHAAARSKAALQSRWES